MLLVKIYIRKISWFITFCFMTLFSFSTLADQKNSFAETLMNGVYIIEKYLKS